MQNIAKTREMLAQIGAACAQLVRGCEGLQTQEIEVDSLNELVWALREILTCAEKLQENAMSITIEPVLDHDGDTQPANEKPEQPNAIEVLAEVFYEGTE